MSDKTNVLPNNLEAEQSVLGCMLIDNDVLSELADKLTDRDFYQESHQMIMSAILQVFNQRKPADIVTLSDCLEKEGNLEKVDTVKAELVSVLDLMNHTDVVLTQAAAKQIEEAYK